MQLAIARNNESLHETLLAYVEAGKRVALVPTMGALHHGHTALIRQAAEQADMVVTSIFVNPKQFGPKEDFSAYPRQLEEDIAMAENAGAGMIYAPTPEEMYPEGFSTNISVGALGQVLCGKFRPGHFDGVATIVAKLLLTITPHIAFFGEKDYQQLVVIRRMVDDLNIPVDIVGVPTVREANGLALSSRNHYLTEQQKAVAPKLYETLTNAAQAIASGQVPVSNTLKKAAASLAKHGYKVEYMELCHSDTLEPVQMFAKPARLLVAAWLGKTRLIDNIPLE